MVQYYIVTLCDIGGNSMNKRSIWKWFFIGIGIILMPFILDKLYSTRIYDSHLTISEWASFNGSYIGAIMGGIITLVGVLITIRFTREQADKDRQFQVDQAKKDREFQREQANEERRLAIAPHLKYTMYEKTMIEKKHEVDIFYCIDKEYNTFINATIELKNIGMGALLDLKVFDLTFNNVDIAYTLDAQNDVLEKNEKWFMLIDLRLRLDDIKSESLRKNPPGSLVEYSPPYEQLNKGGMLSFKLGYTDLIGNQYEQDIEVCLDISCISEEDVTKWKHHTEIRLNKVGKSKVINR